MVYAQGRRPRDARATCPRRARTTARFCISDDEVLTLADAAMKIEDHYSRKAGRPTPMDIEWAKDGVDGQLYIVQARPETVASQRAPSAWSRNTGSAAKGKVLRQRPRRRRQDRHRQGAGHHRRRAARPVPARRGAGRRHHDARLGHGDEERPPRSSPTAAGAPAMRPSSRASSASRRSSAATTRRQRCAPATRSPCPAPRATSAASTPARSPFTVTRTDLSTLARPRTQLMVNLGNPDIAFQTSVAAQRRRRPGAHGVHRRRAHQGASDGAGASGEDRRRQRCASRSRALDRRAIAQPERLLRAASWPKAWA